MRVKKDRGKVWLGVANLVENDKGEWLVVKKKYSGLKGMWSLPAGFVQEAETVEMAAKREVLEETGIHVNVHGIIGFRSGVIRDEISDNMVIFYSTQVDHTQVPFPQEEEIEEIQWIHPTLLAQDPIASAMLHEMARHQVEQFMFPIMKGLDPGKQFGYTDYELYFKKKS